MTDKYIGMIEDEYFDWLVRKVDGEESRELLRQMYDTPFTWTIRMDENRATDGLELRNKFLSEEGNAWKNGYYADTLRDFDCTVLEMILGLAERMDFELWDLSDEYKVPCYFWEMVRNLGLDGHTDSRVVAEKMSTLCERKYDYDGTGGLFPLKEPGCDQRELELWDQLNGYIFENYL